MAGRDEGLEALARSPDAIAFDPELFGSSRAIVHDDGELAETLAFMLDENRTAVATPDQCTAFRWFFGRKYPGNPRDHDVGSHTQIIEDQDHVFPGGSAEAYVRDYVRTMPLGWRDSVVVAVQPGRPVVVCRWTAGRVRFDDTRKWCRSVRGASGDPRFKALPSYSFEGDQRILVPAAPAPPPRPASLAELAPQLPTKATLVHPTGIDALDGVLVNGGLPLAGARVVVQAPTGHGKTTVALHAAEAYAAAGVQVAWIATADEPAESVVRRRLQRLGYTQADATTAPSNDPRLDANLTVVDGRKYDLETVLELVASERAEGRLAVLFIDTLQKTPLREPPSGEVEHVRRALQLIENSGVTVWLTSSLVRGASRRAAAERSKGGSGIEGGATLLLDVALQGDELTLAVAKSRHGGLGAELALRLDREHQRIEAPAGSNPASPLETRIWADVQRVLAAQGAMTVRALRGKVRGRPGAIADVVKAKLGTGQLTQADGRVALP